MNLFYYLHADISTMNTKLRQKYDKRKGTITLMKWPSDNDSNTKAIYKTDNLRIYVSEIELECACKKNN